MREKKYSRELLIRGKYVEVRFPNGTTGLRDLSHSLEVAKLKRKREQKKGEKENV